MLAPLARALGPNGRLVVVQSTGHDPGMEIVRRIWPDDEPFATPRHMLIRSSTASSTTSDGPDRQFTFEGDNDAQALFSYHLHAMPNEVTNRLSTSTALAAWNAAVYVAQIDDERVAAAMQDGDYLQATKRRRAQARRPVVPGRSFVVVTSVITGTAAAGFLRRGCGRSGPSMLARLAGWVIT